MDDTGYAIAHVLKQLRNIRGVSQGTLAETLDVPLRTYQSWEKHYTSSASNLFALAAFYSLPATAFFGALERAIAGDEIDVAGLTNRSFEIALAAAGGAGRDELERRFVDRATAIDSETMINTAILDAYFSNERMMGLVRGERDAALEAALSARLKIKRDRVRVVSTTALHFQSLKEIALGRHGAAMIREWIRGMPLFRLGISNGYTVARILDQLPRNAAENLSLFPLNFTQTPADFSISTTSLISSFQYRHEGRCAEYRPMNEKEVYGATLLADAALLGIGTLMHEGLYSRMIVATLGTAFLERVREVGAIGDFNYYLLGEDGGQLRFPELVAPLGTDESPALIKSVELGLLAEKADRGYPVVAAAAGAHKAELVRLVSENGYINTLLVDSSLARALL